MIISGRELASVRLLEVKQVKNVQQTDDEDTWFGKMQCARASRVSPLPIPPGSVLLVT